MEISKLNAKAKDYSELLTKLHEEISKVVVGQDETVQKLIVGLISNGHMLIEGVPGLAKTLIIKTLSDCLDCDYTRLQFTPDLLPADIVGTKIYDHVNSEFKTMKGPIFSNFVLADEINRAPPKVQSALLEAMQEKQVSIQGDTKALQKPFMVLATQNPIENEGTYQLPEAQVDRFSFKLLIDYPTKENEIEIINRFTEGNVHNISKIMKAKQIVEIQKFNQNIYADENLKTYVAGIVDATRHPKDYGIQYASFIEYGASPRASLWLVLAAKAVAMLDGRGYAKPEDVKNIAHDVLRHRIILTYEAEAEEISPDDVITHILDKIKVP